MDIRLKFKFAFDQYPDIVVQAPGRVNLIGEHVDYNKGPVMPIAIDRYVTLAAAPSPDGKIHLIAADLIRQETIEFKSLEMMMNIYYEPLPNWALYPAGVALMLMKAGYQPAGVYAVYQSTIPSGAGLSSSAAIEVAFALLWRELGGWDIPNMELAQLCQKAENEYVGVSCGLMDQFASLFGIADHALYFDTRSLEWEPLPLPPHTAIVIADTMERHHLIDSAYNDRREACHHVVTKLQQFNPKIKSLRDVSIVEFAAYSEFLSQRDRSYAEHVVHEISRVESVRSALKRQDEQALEALLYASHASLKNLYKVTTPELDTLIDLSRDIPGCFGARMTGAGFGGCTINLVHEDQAETFMNELKRRYEETTGKDVDIFICHAVNGAKAEIIST